MAKERQVPLSGTVATIRIVVDREYDPENALYGMARELQLRIAEYAQKQVRDTLGQDFQVSGIEVHRGSAVILLAIGTGALAVFMTFSRYENFCKSLNLLNTQLTDFCRNLFGDSLQSAGIPPSVSGTWSPGPALDSATHSLMSPGMVDVNHYLLWYLMSSHAALLAVLLWLVARHLK